LFSGNDLLATLKPGGRLIKPEITIGYVLWANIHPHECRFSALVCFLLQRKTRLCKVLARKHAEQRGPGVPGGGAICFSEPKPAKSHQP
jgi:hypothetical protein